jgi:uncharacterized protein (TIGR03437 family)
MRKSTLLSMCAISGRMTQILTLAIVFCALAWSAAPDGVNLVATPNPAGPSVPVTLTADVGAGAIGRVTFYRDTTMLGVGDIAGGHATFTTSMLPAGTGTFWAYYGGDAEHPAARSNRVAHTVVAAPSLGLYPVVSYLPADGSSTGPSMAIGDFNNDGVPDVVFGGGGSGTFDLWFGNGDGTLGPPRVGFPPPCTDVINVIAGDFNNDGNLDLVLECFIQVGPAYANHSEYGFAVALGDGKGNFPEVNDYTYTDNGSDIPPQGLVAGEFNNDGKLDLAGYVGSMSVAIIPGNGDGTFGPLVTYPGVPWIGSSTPTLAVGDFNGDGNTDLIQVLYANSVGVMLGNGDGTLQPPLERMVNTTALLNPNSIAVGDFNGDGKLDAVITGLVNVSGSAVEAGLFNDSVTVLIGNGDGTFGKTITYEVPQNGSVAVADMNGDGKPDVVLAAINAVVVALGDGTGALGPPTTYPFPDCTVVAVAGFGRDGTNDVACAQQGGIGIFLGGAPSGLAITQTHVGDLTGGEPGLTYTLNVTNAGTAPSWGTVRVTDALPQGVTATSLAGAGWTCDLASVTCAQPGGLAAGAAYPPITLSAGVGIGVLGNATNNATVITDGGASTAASSSSDAEFFRSATTTTLSVAPNSPVAGQAVTVTAMVTSGVSGRVVFTSDGTALGEAVIQNGQASLTTTQLPDGTLLLRAQYAGDSTHGPSGSTAKLTVSATATSNGFVSANSVGLNGSQGPVWVAVGDFNRDGKADIATVNSGTNDVSVLLGKGDGTFQTAVNYSLAQSPSWLEVADFNGDGIPDLLATGVNSMNAGVVSVLLGKGDGTFQILPPQLTGQLPIAVPPIADLNLDGKPDLVCVGNFAVTVLLGNGDGTFQSPMTLPVNFGGFGATGDLNGDGIPDLVLETGNGGISVSLGNGDGTFQAPISYPNSRVDVFNLVIGDFDGDGLPDVVSNTQGYPMGLAFWKGNGDGTLQPPVVSASFERPLLAGDFNGDGVPDIAGPGLDIFFGNGDGTFQNALQISLPYPMAVASGDFNGDGRPDFAVALTPNNSITIVLGEFAGLAIQVTHTGAFAAGENGAAYQISVTNPAATSSSGTVTVTDTLPAGFTAVSMTGTGWTCATGTLTCTRSDALPAHGSYPPITLTVNISASVGVPFVSNGASVVAGGNTNVGYDKAAINALYVSGLANAASYATGGFAPNTIVSAYGDFPGCTGTAQVQLGGIQSEVLYSSSRQINFVVPGSAQPNSSSTLGISCAGLYSLPMTVNIAGETPAVLTTTETGIGQAAVVNQDGTVNGTSTAGSVVSVYGTGFGAYSPAGSDGLRHLANTVSAQIGDVVCNVTYAGEAPGYTSGLQQINIEIPTILDPTDLQAALILTVGQLALGQIVNTQAGVTLALKPF